MLDRIGFDPEKISRCAENADPEYQDSLSPKLLKLGGNRRVFKPRFYPRAIHRQYDIAFPKFISVVIRDIITRPAILPDWLDRHLSV